MLDRYLETSIQNKLQAFYYLRSQPEVSIKEMKNLLNTTSANIVSFLHELNSALGGLAEITVQDSHASLFVYENVSFLELLHAVYSESNILRCLCFLITNTKGLPFSAFMDEHFLSKSAAYRVRESCVHYLHSVGLEHSVEEYGLFECLLILTWKRKEFSSPLPPSKDLDMLKELSTTFSNDDYDYLFLAY